MKQTFLFFFLVALAFVSGAPPHHDKDAAPVVKTLKEAFDIDPSGAYSFGFETENAIVRNEQGELKIVKDEDGKDAQALVVKGSFSYQDPEGNPITVVFYADETGFHPEGAHLPVAPEVVSARKN